MKKRIPHFYLSLLICLTLTVDATAQPCPDTSTISTNPNNPINTQFNIAHPGKINPFINSFNWSGFNGTFFGSIPLNPSAGWSGVGNFSMFSPFSSSMAPKYRYLTTLNGAAPSPVTAYDMDWTWERGWELMWLNTGYYPDGQEVNKPKKNSILNTPFSPANEKTPYFVLYNRYTGKLRLFANLFAPFGAVNHIYSIFNYEPDYDASGIFRNLNNYDRPLDMGTINSGATVYNLNQNNNNLWYSNDIQLGYDPCVCEYSTYLNLSLKAMQTFDVKLYGRSVQVEVPINQVEDDYLTQSSIDQGAQTGNNLIYKYTDILYNDYMTQLEDYNTKLKDYNSIKNTLKKEVLKITKDLATSATASAFPTPAAKNLILKNAITIKGKAFPDTTTAEGWAKAAKEASKGLVGKGFDYLSQSFVTSKPTAPTMPTATLSEMRISGEITQTSRVQIAGLFTPGSFRPDGNVIGPFDYPIYNKPVGLFALLEKPEVNYVLDRYYQPTEIIDTGMCIGNVQKNNQWVNDTTYGAPKTKLFKSVNACYLNFGAPLKFKYNDAAEIDKERTQTFVSFTVEFDLDTKILNQYKIPRLDHKIDAMGNKVISGNMDLMHDYEGLNNPDLQTRIYESEWVNLKDANQQVFGLEFMDSVINTTYGRAGSFRPSTECPFFTESYLQSIWPVTLKSIKMKIMADVYFTSNEDINTTQVFTYNIYDRINPQAQTSEVTQLDGVASLKKYRLGELHLANETIAPGHYAVTATNGNTMTIDAEYVKVSGTLAVVAGYTLEINAVKELTVEPEAEIDAEIVMQLKKSYFSTTAFGEVNNTYLANYCAGVNKKYNANNIVRTKNGQPTQKTTQEPTETLNKVVVYPNPANTALNVLLGEKGTYHIELYDLIGKQIQQVHINDGNTATLDLSGVTDGIYLVKISSAKLSRTQKIVVKHN